MKRQRVLVLALCLVNICVPFTALRLMVRWQEGHLACQKRRSTNPHGFSSRTGAGGSEGNWPNPGSTGKNNRSMEAAS